MIFKTRQAVLVKNPRNNHISLAPAGILLFLDDDKPGDRSVVLEGEFKGWTSTASPRASYTTELTPLESLGAVAEE